MPLGHRAWLLSAVAALAACTGSPSKNPDSIREPFPSSGRSDRIGLFIGIDRYPRMNGFDLRGAVHDVLELRDLMTRRFGFQRTALLTNAEATRAAIGEFLRALLEQVKNAAGPVTVLIAYSGHGSYATDQDGDEEDGRDETWVPSDSSLQSAENDIRDDEIFAVLSALSELGARVLLLSDSCHSGTVGRSAAFCRTRSLSRRGDVAGPTRPLFGDLGSPGKDRDERLAVPGLVVYSACRDDEEARECVDSGGRSCGRLNYVLRRVLASARPGDTYASVFRGIAAGFASRGFMTGPYRQTPRLGGDESAAGETFLGAIPKAEPVSLASETFAVCAGEDLPREVRDRLAARYPISSTNYAVSVRSLDPSGLAVYLAEAEDSPLRVCADLDALESALGEIALLHRLRAMERDEGRLEADVAVYRETLTGWQRIEPPSTGGILTLRDGDHFTIRVRNRHTIPLYVHFFDIDLGKPGTLDGIAELLPSPAEEERALDPGKEHEFFTDRRWKVSGRDHAGRHQVKIVGTTERVHFAPLFVRDGARGLAHDDPEQYLKETTRSSSPAWATTSLVIEVQP